MKPIINPDIDFSLSPVGEGSKKGFWSMLVVMLGFTFFSASMWAGGTLGTGLTASRFIIAVFRLLLQFWCMWR